MSTKIFDAYRFKEPGIHWDTLWEIQDTARKNVEARVQTYYKERMANLHYTDPDFDKDPGSWWERLMYVHDKTSSAVAENAGSMRRSEFDADCHVVVMPYEGRLYLRAMCDRVSQLVGGSLDFLEEHPALEEYHYQNCTDKPDDIPQDEWDQREDTWSRIYSGPAYEAKSVRLEVSDALSYWVIAGGFEIAHEYHDNPPTFPTLEELAIQHLQRHGGYIEKPLEGVESPEPGLIRNKDFTIQRVEDGWEARVRGRVHKHERLEEIVCRVMIECLPDKQRQPFEDLLAGMAE